MALTFVAGQRLTPAVLNALIPQYLELGSDAAVSTSATAWTGGSLTIGAGETWEVTCMFQYGGMSSAANDFRLSSPTVTGTVTHGRMFSTGSISAALPTAGSTALQSRDTTAGAVSYGGTTATGSTTSALGIADLRFIVKGGASGGTWVPRIQLSAGTGTIYAGSYILAHRVV